MVTSHSPQKYERLQKYCERWNLSNPAILAETERASLYLVSRGKEKLVLKLLTKEGWEDEKSGVEFLQLLSGQGASRIFECGDHAILIEYLPGPSLRDLVARGQDEEAARITAGILNGIHKVPVPASHNLISLERRFRLLFERPETGYEKLFAQGAEIARHLLTQREKIVLLHGDVHHENILKSAVGTWTVIDPKGVVGDRAYDVANVLLNPWDMPQIVRNERRFLRQVEIFSEEMSLLPQKIINYAFAHACLSAVWFFADYGVPSEHALRMVEMIEPLAKID